MAGRGPRWHSCTYPVVVYGASLVCAILVATVAGVPAIGALCVLGALSMVAGPAASLARGYPVLCPPQAQRLADAISAVDDERDSHIVISVQQDARGPWSFRRSNPPMVLAAPGFVDACDDEHLRALAALALSQVRDSSMTAYAKRISTAACALTCGLAVAGASLVPRSYLIFGAFAPLGLAQWITIGVATAASRRQGVIRTFARTDDVAVTLAGSPELVADTLRRTEAWRTKTPRTPLQVLAQPVRPNWHEAARARRLDASTR